MSPNEEIMTRYKNDPITNEPIPLTAEEMADWERLQAEFRQNEYRQLRASAYPDFRDYLDGIVKNDQAQIQKYIDECLAVKAKYPKPVI
jgi:hypothetical protein